MDPDGKKIFTESQKATAQFTLNTNKTTDEPVTAAGIKAKIAELQKQLALIEVQIGCISLEYRL